MLIVALVLAVIGLAALVTAVVTSNELIAWVCIGASVIGVLLLIVDAVRERSHAEADDESHDGAADESDPEAATSTLEPAEDYPDDTEDTDDTVAAPVVNGDEGVTVAAEAAEDPESAKKD